MTSCRLIGMIDEASVRCQYELLRPSLDERGRRLFAASQVRALGYGAFPWSPEPPAWRRARLDAG